jgi:hypothetical protein
MMPTQKVPPVAMDFVTSDTTIVPAQEAFLVDATTLTQSHHRWIEAQMSSSIAFPCGPMLGSQKLPAYGADKGQAEQEADR